MNGWQHWLGPAIVAVMVTADLLWTKRAERETKKKCRLRPHSWNYSGNAHTHAPAPIKCYRCGKTK